MDDFTLNFCDRLEDRLASRIASFAGQLTGLEVVQAIISLADLMGCNAEEREAIRDILLEADRRESAGE